MSVEAAGERFGDVTPPSLESQQVVLGWQWWGLCFVKEGTVVIYSCYANRRDLISSYKTITALLGEKRVLVLVRGHAS